MSADLVPSEGAVYHRSLPTGMGHTTKCVEEGRPSVYPLTMLCLG